MMNANKETNKETNNISEEFAHFLKMTFIKRFSDRMEKEDVPEEMRDLLKKEGVLICEEIARTDTRVESIEELIELLASKYWDGIMENYTKTTQKTA